MKTTRVAQSNTIIAVPGQSVTFEQAHSTLIVRVIPVGKLLKLDYELIKRIPDLQREQNN